MGEVKNKSSILHRYDSIKAVEEAGHMKKHIEYVQLSLVP